MEISNNPEFNKMIGLRPLTKFRLPYAKDIVCKAIAKAYYDEVIARGNRYECISEEIVADVADWLTSERGRVGMLLYGTVGTGKTTMLNAVCRVINHCVKPEYGELTLKSDFRKVVNIVRAKDVVDAFQADRDLYDKMCKVDLLGIDELGVEAIDVKNYGNTSEPIIDLLSVRYDRQRCTMISSNLDLNKIGERYGDRLQDRFIEMFFMLPFIGKSYRK